MYQEDIQVYSNNLYQLNSWSEQILSYPFEEQEHTSSNELDFAKSDAKSVRAKVKINYLCMSKMLVLSEVKQEPRSGH